MQKKMLQWRDAYDYKNCKHLIGLHRLRIVVNPYYHVCPSFGTATWRMFDLRENTITSY